MGWMGLRKYIEEIIWIIKKIDTGNTGINL